MESKDKPKKKKAFNPDIGKNTRFKKGQVANPNGRPSVKRVLNILSKALTKTRAEELSMTKAEVEEWEGKLISLCLEDLKKICKDPEAPTYVVNVAMAIITDIKNGRTITIDKLRDRRYGKVSDKLEITGKDGAELFKGIEVSDEQKNRLRQILNGGE